MSEIGLSSSLTDQELKNAIVEKQDEIDALNIDISAKKKSSDNICYNFRRYEALYFLCQKNKENYSVFYSCRSDLGFSENELFELIKQTQPKCTRSKRDLVILKERLEVRLKELDILENEYERRQKFGDLAYKPEQIIETVKSQSKQPYFIYAIIGVVIIAVLLIRKKHK